MRRLLMLFLIPMVFGLSVSFQTNPMLPTPGTTVAVLMTLTGNASSISYKIPDPWGMNTWKDIDDVSGTASTVFYLNVPEDYKPGTYYVPITLRFEEGNGTYYQHLVIPLNVVPKESRISVETTGYPVENKKTSMAVIIKNRGPTLTRATVSLIPSLEGTVDVGTIGEKVEVPFTVLSPCVGGVQEFNVVISGYDSAPFTWQKTFTVPCLANTPITVETNLPKTLNPGDVPIGITLKNNGDTPEKLFISVQSNVPIGGRSSETVSLNGGTSTTIPLVLKVSSDDDRVSLMVSVASEEFNGIWNFSAVVNKEPSLLVYVVSTGWKDGFPTAILEVANRGNGDAKNVVLYAGNSTFFIGDLTSGDYDTEEIPLEGNTLPVKVEYSFSGEEKTLTEDLPVNIPPKPSNPWPWIILGLVILYLAYLGWKRHGARADGA